VTSDRPVSRASGTGNGIIHNDDRGDGLAASAPTLRGGPAATSRPARSRGSSPRRELLGILLLGALGAGLVFLAMHQSWAQVRTAVPAPLPTSVVTDSGQDLIPYGEALAIAALASLAAVLATRRLGRRAVGVLLAGLGLGIVAAVTTGVSASAALAAAAQNISPATGSGAGDAAGSATGGGSSAAAAVPNVAGFHSRAVLTATAWQAMAVIGAIAIIAAGVLVVWRANRLPVMSSRYDAPASAGAAVRAGRAPATGPGAGRGTAGRVGPDGAGPGGVGRGRTSADGAGADRAGPDGASPGGASSGGASSGGGAGAAPGEDGEEPDEPDSASMWESLSRGEDPTSAGRHG
jgi:uncharacterized membrane protein (TIGR02234 family)